MLPRRFLTNNNLDFLQLFYQLSLLLFISIQFSTILSQPPLKWRRIQKPMEIPKTSYENPTTPRMIYKSMKPRIANPPPENSLTTDSLVDENSRATPKLGDNDTGNPIPKDLEASTERHNYLDSEGIANAEGNNTDPKLGTDQPNPEGSAENDGDLVNDNHEVTAVINPIPKLGTDQPNLEGGAQTDGDDTHEVTAVINPKPKLGTFLPNLGNETESNEPFINKVIDSNPILETQLKLNHNALVTPAMPFLSAIPSNQRGDFVLQETDYLTKDSLMPLIRSKGGLEKIVQEYNEDVSNQCVLAEEASFTHRLDVMSKSKTNTVVSVIY